MYTAKPTPPPQNQHQDSETEDCFKNGRIQDSEAELVYIYIYNIEGRLEVKLPTIWTDEKQSREEAERRERSEERRVEEKE